MEPGTEIQVDRILLSDDEVIAVAATLGGEWRAALPTVPNDDGFEMVKALGRGQRSLIIRGLLVGGERPALQPELHEAFADLVTRRPDRIGYVANEADVYALDGASFAAYLRGAASTLIVTTANGINEVTTTGEAEIEEFIEAFVAAAIDQGRGPVVVVTPRGDDTAAFVVASRQGVRRGHGPLQELDLTGGAAQTDGFSAELFG